MSLEETLIAIKDYGRPALFCSRDGAWNCSVEMNVSSRGVTFEVKSDFGMATPTLAVQQVYQRILETLNMQPKRLGLK